MPPLTIRGPQQLTSAQRRICGHADVGWIGWDSWGRPVVTAYFKDEEMQKVDEVLANKALRQECEPRQWSVLKNGRPGDIKEPVRV